MKKIDLVNPVIGKLATQVKQVNWLTISWQKTFRTGQSWETAAAIGCAKIWGK